MGTNYYLMKKPPCECCGRPFEDEQQHIGKSSAGWVFSLHVDDAFRSLDDYRAKWSKAGASIRDEYGDPIPIDQMEAIITQRSWKRRDEHTELWYAQNNAAPPDEKSAGCVRHRIGRYCLGHGDGTWDLIPGEFS